MQVDYLDEGCEETWTVKDAYGELYQPVSLCIISRLPLFENFKVKGNIYVLLLWCSGIHYTVMGSHSNLFLMHAVSSLGHFSNYEHCHSQVT